MDESTDTFSRWSIIAGTTDRRHQTMIGKIQRVPLRNVWKHEARDFTTWLEENVVGVCQYQGLGGFVRLKGFGIRRAHSIEKTRKTQFATSRTVRPVLAIKGHWRRALNV